MRRSPRPRCRSAARGFTLIECLVVCAVAAVLTGMLLPLYAHAHERARQSVCCQNLRQIAAAFSLYLQDSDDTYPMNRFPTMTPPHLSKTVGLEPTWYNWKRALSGYVPSAGVFLCPSNDRAWSGQAAAGDETNGYGPWKDRPETWLPNGYAYNGAFFHEDAPFDVIEPQRPRTIGEIPDPARLILLVETPEPLSAINAYYIVNAVFQHPSRRTSNWVMACLEVRQVREADAFAQGLWGSGWITPEESLQIARMLHARGQ